MAYSCHDRPMDSCRCRNEHQKHHYLPRETTNVLSDSTWGEYPARDSFKRWPHDCRQDRSDLKHGCYREGQSSVCQLCGKESCQYGQKWSMNNASQSIDEFRHRYNPFGYHSSKDRTHYVEHRPSEQTEQKLRIQLFEAKKKEKKYEEAIDIYHDILTRGRGQDTSDKVLKLMVSFIDMQITQGNFNEAEHVLEDIHSYKDLPSSIQKQCSRVYGKILCARKRYAEAEDLYRKLYDRASKDEWSLEVGDELCHAIAMQGDLDRAQIEQANLLDKRKKILGIAHPATVKSAATAVENIRKLMQKTSKDNGDVAERSFRRKQALEVDIEYLLGDIWMSLAGTNQKREPNILKLGFELGVSLSSQKKFHEAEPVLKEVWHERKTKLGESHKDTMSSAILLGQAMYRQDFDPPDRQEYGAPIIGSELGRTAFGQDWSQEPYTKDNMSKCLAAVPILESVAFSGKKKAYGDEYSIIIVACVHLGVVLARIGNLGPADDLLTSSAHVTVSGGGVPMPPPALVRLAIHETRPGCYRAMGPGSEHYQDKGQGMRPYQLTAYNATLPSRMLSASQSPTAVRFPIQNRMSQNQLAITSGSLDTIPSSSGMNGLEEGYFRNALISGKHCMQTRGYNAALNTLGEAWNEHAATVKGTELRAKCGHLFGLCLERLKRHDEATEVLEDVQALKRQLYPGQSNRELYSTGSLLRKIAHQRSRPRKEKFWRTW